MLLFLFKAFSLPFDKHDVEEREKKKKNLRLVVKKKKKKKEIRTQTFLRHY